MLAISERNWNYFEVILEAAPLVSSLPIIIKEK